MMAKTGKKRRGSHWETAADTVRRKSQRQERRISKQLGAELTPNSGATDMDKSDAKTRKYRYEMKTTGGKSLSMVKVDHLEKIWKEATLSSRTPAVVITAEAMPGHAPKDWVMIPLEDFRGLSGEGPED